MSNLDNNLDRTKPKPTVPPADPSAPHPKHQEAMAVFARIQRNRTTGLSINIRDVASQLRSGITTHQFPEQYFVEFFLPMFAGEVEETPHVSMRSWVEKVSGGETKSVEIVDASGKVIFIVPPVFDMSGLEQSKSGGATMTRIERQYSRLKEFNVTASQQFLMKSLEGVHVKEKVPEEMFTNIRTWNDIFERYGRKDKIINLMDLKNDPNKNKPSGVTKPETNTGNGFGDYELDTD